MPAVADHLLARAAVLRGQGRVAEAAVLYGEAAAIVPNRADWLVQQGRMHEEAGQLVAAGRAYERALLARPNWSDAADALRRLAESGWTGANGPTGARAVGLTTHRRAEPSALGPDQIARLLPELAPRPRDTLLRDYREELLVRHFGRHEHGFWGNARTLRGVEAIRGYCVSQRPIIDVQVRLNDLIVYVGPLRGGCQLADAWHVDAVRKYVFNIWLDVSALAPGRYAAEIRCRDVEENAFSFSDHVVIAEPLPLDLAPRSDALVPLTERDPDALEREIRALPSVARPARRTLFPSPPRNVLAMRTDQLGDMISSIAAIRRLRALLPEARIVGLLTAANADLALTLKLFDEVIVIEFPDDPMERRRLMPLVDQEALRQRLATHDFDLAIDLAESNVSRPLLLLSGAPFLYGVGGGDWPWLTAEFSLSTHDRLNRLDCIPHAAKTLALVETLGAMLGSSFEPRRRGDLDPRCLERLGLALGARYVILHQGARIAFSRWPWFAELATLVLARTGLDVVMMTEDAALRPSLPAALLANPRFHLFDQRLPFDDFDALVSFCKVLVGNDSGPKHLAALRGVHVVTVFTARINWTEWAQEELGTVISRRVPCAGCALFHEPEECGKEFACIRDIRPEEVFAAMRLDQVAERVDP